MFSASHSRAWLLAAGLLAAMVASPVAAVSPALPPPADEQTESGAALLRSCADLSADRCWTYVAGVSDGVLAAYAPGAKPYCLPGGLRPAELAGAVHRYLALHPEGRQGPATRIVVDALTTGYPCPGGRRQG